MNTFSVPGHLQVFRAFCAQIVTEISQTWNHEAKRCLQSSWGFYRHKHLGRAKQINTSATIRSPSGSGTVASITSAIYGKRSWSETKYCHIWRKTRQSVLVVSSCCGGILAARGPDERLDIFRIGWSFCKTIDPKQTAKARQECQQK